MKKIIYPLLISIFPYFHISCLYAEVKVAPYYSLQFAEGAFIPNVGEWNFSVNLLSDLGVIVKPEGKHSYVGFYELKYTGPGLKRQEGEKFTDRTMDHLVVLRHNYKIWENYFLKSQFDYMKEYKRTGSNEIWGTGLYDFSRLGGLVSFEKKFSDELSSNISLQYHFLNFPNYTDLLAEYQAGGENIESSTGKQNHALYQPGFSVNYKANHFTTDIIFQNYTKQKVAVERIQLDGTYYSSDLQKDTIISFSLSHSENLWKKILFSPEISYKIKNSNQNYLHFASIESTETPSYFADYYDYNQFTFSFPVSFILQEKWEVSTSPEFDFKSYTKRPPQDDEGNFLTNKKQRNNQFILTSGVTFKPNSVTRTTVFYTFQNQSSNMKFERYLPYNYTGNYFGIKFEYTY
ncbi:MAG: hypothetical protein CVU80_00950 [Elusimicrobia bacterium HGW-Elusimicrobia-4]|nr:MAG: hypothetical protein CVU80_00950 [Elusimicrobia bacterium HGW-Elusimicrobia-4]